MSLLNKKSASSSPLRITRNISRGELIEFEFNHQKYSAYSGETIATALMANNIRLFGFNPVSGEPQGLFCAMGVCQQCLVLINDHLVEACQYPISQGLKIFAGKISTPQYTTLASNTHN
ncbi:(2Fe-2S)-binding protein [Aliikangiella maris]|uniref:(2Fe-2S)-binding protein n=2 Tax=Aliikangiella maris TaxID=3162458 RepID=A0ABV3MR45_9GAMM